MADWIQVPLRALAFDADLLVPLAAIMMIFGIPIAAILTAHQRKMAEILHGKQQQQRDVTAPAMEAMHEVAKLRQQIASLQDQVNYLTIERDPSPTAALQQRTSESHDQTSSV